MLVVASMYVDPAKHRLFADIDVQLVAALTIYCLEGSQIRQLRDTFPIVVDCLIVFS